MREPCGLEVLHPEITFDDGGDSLARVAAAGELVVLRVTPAARKGRVGIHVSSKLLLRQ
jgi:hypothetical protein